MQRRWNSFCVARFEVVQSDTSKLFWPLLRRVQTRVGTLCLAIVLALVGEVDAQNLDTPASRLRPITRPPASGPSPSYSQPIPHTQLHPTAYRRDAEAVNGQQVNAQGQYQVQQTAMQFEVPPLPNSAGSTPSGGNAPIGFPPNTLSPSVGSPNSLPSQPGNLVPSTTLPGTASPAPRGLPVNPNNAPMYDPRVAAPGTSPSGLNPVPLSPSVQSSSDLSPVPTPQLNAGFATIDNCNCVSGPSNYVAISGTSGCAPISYETPATYAPPQTYVAPPNQIAAPAILPDSIATPRARGIPKGPLISFGQDRFPVEVGQGILGQPVAYVPGQRFRNWIRYIFP